MIRFDTLDKKPKLWNIAVLTGITGAAAALMLILGGERMSSAVSLMFCVYDAAVLFLLIRALVRQIRYNPYSYNTVYYIGFSIFVLFVLITQAMLTAAIFRQPDVYTGDAFLHTFLGWAGSFMIYTFPFLLIFSVGLCVSNISLIRHEGRRPVNLLGILLSFLIVAGVLVHFWYNYSASGSQTEVMIHDMIANLFSAVYLYFECMLVGTIAAGVIAAKYEPEKDKDFLIVLGCGLRDDGTPTPLLRGRLDRALAFYEKQKEETGKDLVFVTSGGQGKDEIISESASMKRYLTEHGVDPQRIIEEDRSETTMENMKYSKEKILQSGIQGKVAFSTTNYHVLRSGLCARRVKMRAQGMGAQTRWYFWPNASVREFVGLLTEHRGKQALILGGMLVFYVVLTLAAYR